MFKEDYGEAAVEVLDILDNTKREDVDKIPQSFIKFLVDSASLDYKVNLDHSKTIEEMNLNGKTRELLGYIYINWWSNEKEKEEYKQERRRIEQEKQENIREKYNPNNIFEVSKRSKQSEVIQEKEENLSDTFKIVKYKESIFKRIINKIKSFFGR